MMNNIAICKRAYNDYVKMFVLDNNNPSVCVAYTAIEIELCLDNAEFSDHLGYIEIREGQAFTVWCNRWEYCRDVRGLFIKCYMKPQFSIKDSFVNALCLWLKSDNPDFDKNKFKRACGLK